VKMHLALTEHPSVEILEEYCFKRLPPALLEPLEEHLLICEICQDALLEIDEYIQLMKFAIAERAAGPSPRIPMARAWQTLREAAKKSSLGSATTWTAILVPSLMAVIWMFTSFRPDPPGPAFPVRLVAMRGGENASFTPAPVGRALGLTIDTTELPVPDSYRIEIVSASGRPVWTSAAPLSGREIAASTPKVTKAGVYWVRLYASHGHELLREYGLKLE
jgi:hypothetical protein